MFRNVPACSGMFRVPGFIDAFHSYQFSSQMITTQFTAIYKKPCSTGPFLFLQWLRMPAKNGKRFSLTSLFLSSTSRLKNDYSDPTVSKSQEIAYRPLRFVAFCPSTGYVGMIDCQPNQYFQVALKTRILNGYTKYGSFVLAISGTR